MAAALWQKLLNEAGDLLIAEEVVKPVATTSTPLLIYRPVRERVEQRMIQSPAALAAYRTTADAEAAALLAKVTPEQEEKALAEVVRRFFLSSQGDEAAFKLACLALDRWDFVAANRLLRSRAEGLGVAVKVPPPELCTDNAAMIASAARWVQPRQFPDYLDLDAYATAPRRASAAAA